MKLINQITSYGIISLLTFFLLMMGYASINHDPHWHIEEEAVASSDHPLAGFWKQERCEEPWGWAIGPVTPDSYYVSFCGPGGCLDRGEYRPNTPIFDDPTYQVIDENTLLFLIEGDWQTMVRCGSRN